MGEGLRALLIIKMNSDAVGLFVSTVRGMQGTTIKELLGRSKAKPETLDTFTSEPEQSVALMANMVGVSFTTMEGCFDFYQASASSMTLVPQRNKLAVDPVVRVEMRLALADALMDELHKVNEAFAAG
ncbi:hypothetical protein D0B32_02130 [Paraburkholderia sp. DHOC27]|nr:hypothetical protein D0B32_02130 [Paraburkholderia sp. DHOC27]